MSDPAPLAVKSLDHVVLTVKDYQTTIDFYATNLGMKHEKFVSKDDERYAASSQRLNLPRTPGTF